MRGSVKCLFFFFLPLSVSENWQKPLHVNGNFPENLYLHSQKYLWQKIFCLLLFIQGIWDWVWISKLHLVCRSILDPRLYKHRAKLSAQHAYSLRSDWLISLLLWFFWGGFSRFLDEVQAHSSVNKMSVQNLATVFGPNILRPKMEDPVTMMEGRYSSWEITQHLYFGAAGRWWEVLHVVSLNAQSATSQTIHFISACEWMHQSGHCYPTCHWSGNVSFLQHGDASALLCPFSCWERFSHLLLKWKVKSSSVPCSSIKLLLFSITAFGCI